YHQILHSFPTRRSSDLVVGHRHRVELADRILAVEDAARILPGHGRAGLDLRPGNLRPGALAQAALGDEVVDPALAFGVAGVPVLDRKSTRLNSSHVKIS